MQLTKLKFAKIKWIKIILILCIILFHFIGSAQDYNERVLPIIKGSYLGQTPPGLIPKVFAPDIVSTDTHGELNAIFSPDGKEFYFTLEVIPGRTYKTYFMQLHNEIWSKPKIYNILGKYQGGEPNFNPSGNYLYFGSNLNKDREKQDNVDIWKYALDGGTEPVNIRTINTKFNEAYPSVSVSNTIYFHSNRPGGIGGFDIYYSNYVDGNYIEPINLDENINSQYHDFHPCISPDGSYLIFSSLNRPEGYGGLDLYVSFSDKNGNWTKAINLGEDINSEAGDYMPFISKDHRYIFFTSTRVIGYTGNNVTMYAKPDIYWVDAKIIDRLKPF